MLCILTVNTVGYCTRHFAGSSETIDTLFFTRVICNNNNNTRIYSARLTKYVQACITKLYSDRQITERNEFLNIYETRKKRSQAKFVPSERSIERERTLAECTTTSWQPVLSAVSRAPSWSTLVDGESLNQDGKVYRTLTSGWSASCCTA